MRRMIQNLFLLYGLIPCTTLSLAQTANHIVISEIRYDERTGVNEEFVELYNPTNSDISLNGWTLSYKKREGGTWKTKETFGTEHQIPAHGFFLWGGDSLVVIPDVIEMNKSALGLANSGGNIVLKDSSDAIIDQVAWEGGDSPEGSGDAGKTKDGGSLERKASAGSTNESMASGGEEENAGNGYDTDDNANDFIVKDFEDVNPQTSQSPQEPRSSTGDGSGIGMVSPDEVYASESVDIRIVIKGDSVNIIKRAGIIILPEWEWSGNVEQVSLQGPGFQISDRSVSGDTVLVSNSEITETDSGIVVISDVTAPALSGEFFFQILTAIDEGELTPIINPPSVRVVDPVVPIINLHQNDAQGLLVSPYEQGKEVTVCGIVTVGSGIFSSSKTDIYIQDKTAGIGIYSNEISCQFKTGDSVSIKGTLDQYKGMTQIIPDMDKVVIFSQGDPVPAPKVLTCAEINQAFHPDNSEPDEGRLVRVNNVVYNKRNFLITDSTDSTKLYIDADTDVSEPAGKFDVVGILKQYKPDGKPYTSGYEIIPRFQQDIILQSGPSIISGPEIVEWENGSVSVGWHTDTLSTSIVHYGFSSTYTDTVTDQNMTTYHRIKLTGLSPGTIYHYQVVSRNQSRSNMTGDDLFITLSDISSTGEMNVYFNGSIDKPAAAAKIALGNQDLAQRLIQRIDKAQFSIDACFYSLSDTSVQNALVRAYKRGVNVRLIYDADHEISSISAIQSAGLPVIQDDFGSNESTGIMHNKFVVFDHKDNTSFSDDWVWTGSWNPSFSTPYPTPVENCIEIQDQALAEIYTTEFEEMWGSNNDIPDPVKSRFGPRKKNNTPSTVIVNGIQIDPVMGPSGKSSQKIVDAIQSADNSLYFCIFSFTRDEIAQAILNSYNGKSGFQLCGVFDSLQTENDGVFSQWHTLSGVGSLVDVWQDKEKGLLHHKYMIMDSDNPVSDPVVVTGSMNWSNNAENVNDENLLIIHSPEIANLYLQEFSARYHTAGGKASFPSQIKNDGDTRSPGKMMLYPNFPNPFNASTVIRYALVKRGTIQMTVYDVRGRSIKELCYRHQDPGSYRLCWDGKDRTGSDLPSGVYLIQMTSQEEVVNRKAVLLR
jgi:phosphatidylserine/phosphatidylglycerophosphate/cardiolipin synthase-like enzyme